MFGNQGRIRETIHEWFGSKEEKSRGSAINTMMAAHIYENWGDGPAKNEPQKWPDYQKVERENRENKDAAKGIWPNAPLEPKSYREILSEMFGKSEQREDFKDRTSATIPGLLPPSARKIEEHERGR